MTISGPIGRSIIIRPAVARWEAKSTLRDEIARKGRKSVTSGIEAILETLNAHYTFDARGRIEGARIIEGVLPRFVLGRAVEGSVWRFGADLPEASVGALARLAGREAGARFDGELPAPPERLGAFRRILASGEGFEPSPRRETVTRDGVDCGELWIFD